MGIESTPYPLKIITCTCPQCECDGCEAGALVEGWTDQPGWEEGAGPFADGTTISTGERERRRHVLLDRTLLGVCERMLRPMRSGDD